MVLRGRFNGLLCLSFTLTLLVPVERLGLLSCVSGATVLNFHCKGWSHDRLDFACAGLGKFCGKFFDTVALTLSLAMSAQLVL